MAHTKAKKRERGFQSRESALKAIEEKGWPGAEETYNLSNSIGPIEWAYRSWKTQDHLDDESLKQFGYQSLNTAHGVPPKKMVLEYLNKKIKKDKEWLKHCEQYYERFKALYEASSNNDEEKLIELMEKGYAGEHYSRLIKGDERERERAIWAIKLEYKKEQKLKSNERSLRTAHVLYHRDKKMKEDFAKNYDDIISTGFDGKRTKPRHGIESKIATYVGILAGGAGLATLSTNLTGNVVGTNSTASYLGILLIAAGLIGTYLFFKKK